MVSGGPGREGQERGCGQEPGVVAGSVGPLAAAVNVVVAGPTGDVPPVPDPPPPKPLGLGPLETLEAVVPVVDPQVLEPVVEEVEAEEGVAAPDTEALAEPGAEVLAAEVLVIAPEVWDEVGVVEEGEEGDVGAVEVGAEEGVDVEGEEVPGGVAAPASEVQPGSVACPLPEDPAVDEVLSTVGSLCT